MYVIEEKIVMKGLNRYQREQFKTREIFTDSKKYLEEDKYSGVEFVGRETQNFDVFDNTVRFTILLVVVVLVMFLVYYGMFLN